MPTRGQAPAWTAGRNVATSVDPEANCAPPRRSKSRGTITMLTHGHGSRVSATPPRVPFYSLLRREDDAPDLSVTQSGVIKRSVWTKREVGCTFPAGKLCRSTARVIGVKRENAITPHVGEQILRVSRTEPIVAVRHESAAGYD